MALEQPLQLPGVIEQAALRLVQFCSEPEAGLAARLSTALGAILPLARAGAWLKSVADWQGVNGSSTLGYWSVKAELAQKYGFSTVLPPSLAARLATPPSAPSSVPSLTDFQARLKQQMRGIAGSGAAGPLTFGNPQPLQQQPQGGVPPPGINPSLLSQLAMMQQLQQQGSLPPALAAAAAAAVAGAMQQQQQQQQQAGAAPAAGQRPFNLLELIGDTSQGVSLDQASILQRAIRSLRDVQLAASLGALAAMAPPQLQELLSTQGVDVRDVINKLVKHIDPVKARENFGPGFYYGPNPPPTQQQNPGMGMMGMMQAALNSGRVNPAILAASGNPAMAAAVAAAAAQHHQQQRQAQQQQMALHMMGLNQQHKLKHGGKQRAGAVAGGSGGAPASGGVMPSGPGAAASGSQAHPPSVGVMPPHLMPAEALLEDLPTPSGQEATVPRKQRFTRNSMKCLTCLKTYEEATFSPLCMCDFCPRSYHMACMAPTLSAPTANPPLGDSTAVDAVMTDSTVPGAASGEASHSLGRDGGDAVPPPDLPMTDVPLVAPPGEGAPLTGAVADGMGGVDTGPSGAMTSNVFGFAELEGISWACPRCKEDHARRLEGLPELPLEAAFSLEVMGEAHPDYDRLDRSERRATEKEHRDRRLAEERQAREKRYGVLQPDGSSGGGSAQWLLGPTDDPDGMLLLNGEDFATGFHGTDFGPGALFPSRGGGGRGLRGAPQGPVPADPPPMASRFHDFPLTPMDEEGLRLRGIALRRGKPEADDSELNEEESAEVWIQEALITELQQRAETGLPPKGAEAVAATAAAASAAASGASSAPLLSVLAEILRDRPAGGKRSAKSAVEMAMDAEEKLARCKLASEGPQRCQAFTSDTGHYRSFMDAVAVSEFSLSFGAMVGMPAVTVPELRHAAAHPLAPDGGPRTLYRIYFTLLRYTLSQWASYGGKLIPRMRRWMRLLQRGGSTWQEVLRRYILLTRAGAPVLHGELDAPLEDMTDDIAVVQFAVELGRGPYHNLPAAMHLRVLRVLVDDLADGQAIRTELQARLDWMEGGGAKGASIRDNEKKRKVDGVSAKKGKKGPAAGAASASSLTSMDGLVGSAPSSLLANAAVLRGTPPPGSPLGVPLVAPDGAVVLPGVVPMEVDGDGFALPSAPSFGGGSLPSSMVKKTVGVGKPKVGGVGKRRGMAGDDDLDWNADVPGGEEWGRKEAEAEAEARRLGLRSEPLGMDRYCRRYWFLGGTCDLLYVEEAEGDGLGLVGSVAELDEIIARLNSRGIRESALLAQLYRIRGRVSAALKIMAPLAPVPSEDTTATSPAPVTPAMSPLLLPGDPSAYPALLPGCLTAMEAIGEVAPVMAPINVPHPSLLAEPPADDGTLPVFPGRFRSLIPDESDAEDEEEESRIVVRERREKVVAEARRAVEAGQVAEVEVRAASREEPYALSVACRDLVRLMGRLERASEGSLGGLKEGESLAWRDRIEKVRDVPGLLQTLLQCEAVIGTMLDGQPEGASDEDLKETVREAEDYELEFVLPAAAAAATEAAVANAESQPDGVVKMEVDGATEVGTSPQSAKGLKVEEGTTQDEGAPLASPSSATAATAAASGGFSSPRAGGGVMRQKVTKKPLAAAPGTAADMAAVKTEGAVAVDAAGLSEPSTCTPTAACVPESTGATDAAAATGVDDDGGAAAPPPVKLVCQLEELDDSEAEDRQRERMDRSAQVAAALAGGANPALLAPRTRVALWRTRRERAVFLREVRRAQLSTAATPAISYVSALLADRGEVVVAGWQLLKQAERDEEQASKERAAAAAAGLPIPGEVGISGASFTGGAVGAGKGPSPLLADAACCICGSIGGDSVMVVCEGPGCLGVVAHEECVGGPAGRPVPWLCVVCELNRGNGGVYLGGDGDPMYGGGMQRGRRAAAVAGVAALTASMGSKRLQTQHSARMQGDW